MGVVYAVGGVAGSSNADLISFQWEKDLKGVVEKNIIGTIEYENK